MVPLPPHRDLRFWGRQDMTDSVAISAKVLVPQSKTDPSDVKIEEIPLPPVEMWAELDNAKSQTNTNSRPEPQSPKPAAGRKVEKLTFLSRDVERTIPLEFPFEHDQLGLVASITVRRLTVGELGGIIDARDPDAPDNFDIYAVMTGVPAPVLRGLMADDGEEVSQVCFDFLPRIFRPRASAPQSTSEAGAR